MEPYLLDTGILLRLLDADDPMHQSVRQAVRQLRARPVGFVTTFQNMCEFWNVSTRPATARGGLGLDVEKVERQSRLIERWCPVVADSPAVYPIWRRLVTEYRVKGASVHDGRLVATMLHHGLKQIVTLNDRHFRRYVPEGIVVLTPEEILDVGH